MHDHRSAARPAFDTVLQNITDYALGYDASKSTLALETARYCLLDTLGCGLMALAHPECVKLLGPIAPGADMPGGARVPGTNYQLDPVTAAFNIGCMIRWLDFNDCWLAAEWGHPSDNLGGILAVADYLSRKNLRSGQAPLTVRQVLEAMIKAHEIQGVTALENSFNRVGLDHVMLVRIATTAVVATMLGGDRGEVLNAVSQAWIDGSALRTYRHAPNTGARKSWAAGDATARGVRLALMALNGEMGYPSALSVPKWGFQDVLFKGQELRYSQPFGTYVMENILFKIAYPAEFHAQTAVEAALTLHPQVASRLDEIERIEIETHEAALRIIDKTGPLDNYADRDHCLQYMVAVALLKGRLIAEDYSDASACDPCIDRLREKMQLRENPRFSREYLEPEKRYIANSLQVFFKDDRSTEKLAIDAPIGHRERRAEGIPLLLAKFEKALRSHLSSKQCRQILALCDNPERLDRTPVNEFVDLFVV